jgi:epoxyqueuosine reductase
VKESIRQKALVLGFDLCRFASAAPPNHVAEFARWLVAGRHGEMSWIERNAAKRLDPQRVLAGARSVVVVAATYPATNLSTGASRVAGEASGVVARYARGGDYHKVLEPALRSLAEHVDSSAGNDTRSLWYTDTGPILERDFAQRAGLGFVGKHTNIIARGLGNWLLLGEIITTAEIAPDAPETNYCGRCERCITACPTAAIVAPFELDARRCVSYLTIEHKGPIPPELRPAIGNRVFGCDDCLAVCPWNRFAREGSLMRASARPDLAALNLQGLLRLDDAGFKALFAGTPMVRAKRGGLVRNACVALGNVGSRQDLAALESARLRESPLIAEHAAWAIQQIEAREKP